MEKLTIQHLKGYLGTGLKVQYRDCLTNRKRTAFLSGITNDGMETTYPRKINGCSGDMISFEGHNNVIDLNVKLLLYPLSSLTKEQLIELFEIVFGGSSSVLLPYPLTAEALCSCKN